jgi:uncharacterized protein YndB with AHSA1/START domain
VSDDIASHLGAITRQVEPREHDGRPARAVIATRSYDTTIEDLWEAITSPERIPRWFLPITGDLRLGGRYQLQGNAGGEITRCEPPRLLAVTWEFGGEVSWVEVRLAEGAGGTDLRLEHLAHVDDDRWGTYGPGAVGVGWDLTLHGLALYLRGTPVDPAQAEAWTMSEEGRAFMRGSSEGWGSASVASGTEPGAARAAVERTTAFYTGEGTGG